MASSRRANPHAAVIVLVEGALEAVEDVVGSLHAVGGGGLGGSDGPVTRAADEDDLVIVGDPGIAQLGHERLIVRAVGESVPFDEDRSLAEYFEVGNTDEGPLRAGPTVHQHGLGIVLQLLPGLSRGQISGIGHEVHTFHSPFSRTTTVGTVCF